MLCAITVHVLCHQFCRANDRGSRGRWAETSAALLRVAKSAKTLGGISFGQFVGSQKYETIWSKLARVHVRPAFKLEKKDPRFRTTVATRASDLPPLAVASAS